MIEVVNYRNLMDHRNFQAAIIQIELKATQIVLEIVFMN